MEKQITDNEQEEQMHKSKCGSRCKSCECKGHNEKFKIKPFEFRLSRVRDLNRPYTRPGKVFGHMLCMIDSIVGIISFGYFESNFQIEWIDRELDRFGQYILTSDVCKKEDDNIC